MAKLIDGPTFLANLTVLFIGLKLGGVVPWGWAVVLLPGYGPIGLAVLYFGIAVGLGYRLKVTKG